jgi:class 3 adenylate cyclase
MEPRVRYARTGDGVSIAFATVGAGPPLLEMSPLPFRHFLQSWQFPEERRWFQRLAREHLLVQYDPRGMGLSDREVAAYDEDRLVADVEAVLDGAGVPQVALLAFLTSGPLAIAYAARHPERVSHLILWCSGARVADVLPPQFDAMLALIEKDWELFTEATMRAYRGWAATGDAAHRQARFLRECIAPQTMQALMRMAPSVDTTPLLAQVAVPTLVVHYRHFPWLRVELATRLASQIPGARLTLLDGEWTPFSTPDGLEIAARIVDAFVAGREVVGIASEPVPPPRTHGLLTILFTDVEGSASLTERLGDAGAREVLRVHDDVVRAALRTHGGTEIKAMGDGFMASFDSAARALACAVAVQEGIAASNAARPPTAIRVRIGINAGEPLAEDGDLYGTVVNVAARIAEHAQGGRILVSEVVRQLVEGKGFAFADRGETALRGFERPVRLHELRGRRG